MPTDERTIAEIAPSARVTAKSKTGLLSGGSLPKGLPCVTDATNRLSCDHANDDNQTQDCEESKAA